MRRAVSWDSAPFMRTVRCLTVAKTLSIGFKVAQVVPMIGGKVEEHQQCLPILDQAFDGLVVFGRVFFGEGRHRRFRRARLGDSQISRRSLCALGCIDFGSLSSTFNVLCSQHR